MKPAVIMLLVAISALVFSICFPPLVSDYARSADVSRKPSGVNNSVAIPVYPPLRHYSAIVSKPLFVSSRVGEASVSSPKSVQMSSTLVLDGVVQTPAAAFVMIREKNKPEQHKLAVGEAVAGWSVREIQKSSVTLERGQDRLLLKLYDKSDENLQPAVPSIGIGKAVAAREAALPRGAVTRPADMSRLLDAQGRVDSNAEAKRLMDEFEEQINEQRL